jgi:predicted outer membrane repeat protein
MCGHINAQHCDDIKTDLSLTQLHSIIRNSDSTSGEVSICPFHISDKNCDTNGEPLIISDFDVFLRCDDQVGTLNRFCVIDCPGTHFYVENQNILYLEKFALRGATKGSVKVSEGLLLSYNSRWENNDNSMGIGGAIYAEAMAGVIAVSTTFTKNTASDKGGAIYFEGSAQLDVSSFTQNESELGGAIYGAPGSSLVLTQSKLEKNVAAQKGPAVYLDSQGNVATVSNEACANRIDVLFHLTLESAFHRDVPSDSDNCDGVYSVDTQECTSFETKCIVVTEDPPTNQPTQIPHSKQSDAPSVAPTSESTSSRGPTFPPSKLRLENQKSAKKAR